jgi:site-specific recombinase XerD
MARFNPQNERIKREYFEFLRQADQKSESTVRGIEKALLRFEEHCEFANFTKFKAAQGMSFKKALARPPAGGRALSPATVHSTLTAVQRFLRWLICQPGFKSKIKATDINYLNLSEKDVRAAASSPSKSYPTLEQLRHVLAMMPATTEVERRDRAVFALIMLTGIRDNAAASLRIKHVDLERMLILQDPTEVRTKNSKLIETVLLPLGEEVERALTDWVVYLREQLLYGGDDPLFPQTASTYDPQRGLGKGGLKRTCWSNAAPIRDIFKRALTAAGIQYFSPHRVRDTLVAHGYQWCRTPEELKALSQNLGHSQVATTLISYGTIALHRQRELIRGAGQRDGQQDKLDRLMALLEQRLT